MEIDYTKRITIDERYTKRKSDHLPGWSDDYEAKLARIQEVLDEVPVPKGSKFLELGCGAGNIVLSMVKLGFEAYGIDLSSAAISWAEEKMKESGLSASFSLGNVVELNEYTAEFFGVVYDGDCLHMIIGADRKTCLSNIYRILKPNGLFLAHAKLLNEQLQDKYYITPDNIFDPQTQCLLCDGIPYYYLSREEEFIRELNQVGFKVQSSKQFPPKHNEHPFIAGSLSAVARKE
jgi:ubiquinone/menaquinone biosynthesis C-methylase UbiE